MCIENVVKSYKEQDRAASKILLASRTSSVMVDGLVCNLQLHKIMQSVNDVPIDIGSNALSSDLIRIALFIQTKCFTQ